MNEFLTTIALRSVLANDQAVAAVFGVVLSATIT